MIPFNYHHLFYFYQVAKAGSIAEAQKSLLLAQPTISAQLKQFERFLGYPLFDRVHQRLHLTEEGRVVLDYARTIFEMGDELVDRFKDRPARGRQGIQIGILLGSPRAHAQALLSALYALDPEALVSVREGLQEDLLEDLRTHRMDLILTDRVVRGQIQEEFSNRVVGKVPVVLVGTPVLASRYQGRPQRLEGAPLILPAPGPLQDQIHEIFAQWGVKPKVRAEVQDVELARRLALEGLGLLPLNVHTLKRSLPKGGLVPLRLTPSWGLLEPVYLVMRRRRWPNPLAQELIEKFRIPTVPFSQIHGGSNVRGRSK